MCKAACLCTWVCEDNSCLCVARHVCVAGTLRVGGSELRAVCVFGVCVSATLAPRQGGREGGLGGGLWAQVSSALTVWPRWVPVPF